MKRLVLTSIATIGLMFSHVQVEAKEGGIKLGKLTCEVAGGTGFIFGSSKDLSCLFTPVNPKYSPEKYSGTINKFGIDIGYTGRSRIIWAVVSGSTKDFDSGELVGRYSGASAEAALVVGLGANVLVGGAGNNFALQPLSVSTSEGVNIAAGIAQIRLKK